MVLKIVKNVKEVEELAKKVADTGGVYFVPAFTCLASPYWDQYARGLLVGVTAATSIAQIARATLESIAYLNKDVIDTIIKDARFNIKEIKVDGGGSKNNFLMQLQADIT